MNFPSISTHDPQRESNNIPLSSSKTSKNVYGLKQIRESIQGTFSVPTSSPEPASKEIHTIEVSVPIRKRPLIKQIEQQEHEAIAKVDLHTNKEINELGAFDEQGIIASRLLQERDWKVQEIKEKATQEKKELLNPNTERFVTENLNEEDEKLIALFEGYQKQLAAIEQEEVESIKKIKNDSKENFRLRRDSTLRIEIEKDQQQKIEKAHQKAKAQTNYLLLKATYQCHPYQKDFFGEVLTRYRKRQVLNEETLQDMGRSLERSFQREKKILKDLFSQHSLSGQKLATAIETIEEENQKRLSLLQPAVRASTTQKLQVLTLLEEKLTPKSFSLAKSGEQQKANELLQQLDKMHTDYFIAEAISTDLAQKVAEEAVTQLAKESKKIAKRLKETEEEAEKIGKLNPLGLDPDFAHKKAQFLSLASFYQTLQEYLEKAQQAYQQIAVDCSLRIKETLEFKDKVAIFRQASLFNRQDSEDTDLQGLLSQQSFIHENQKLTRALSARAPSNLENTVVTLQRQHSQRLHSHPEEKIPPLRRGLPASLSLREVVEEHSMEEDSLIFGLDFLEKLEEIPSEKDSYILVAKRGEIELVSPARADESNDLEGLHLVRLMIFRDYGVEGLARFDENFQEKIRLERPLTLGELITFIDEENERNQSAFYLSSARSLKELVVDEHNEKQDAKLIKISSSSFTISLTTPTSAKKDLNEIESQQEVLKAVQEEIKVFFRNLPPHHLEKTLERFSQEFEQEEEIKGEEKKDFFPVSDSHEKRILTVGKLRSFLMKEIEIHQSDFSKIDITAVLFDTLTPHMEALYAGLIGAAGLSSGVMILFDIMKSLVTRLGVFRYVRSMLSR